MTQQRIIVVFIGLSILAIMAMGTPARGGLLSLTDDNSTAEIVTNTQEGMRTWQIDGIDHMSQQWFWYRVGAAGPESSIDTLPIDVEGTTDTNLDGDDDTAYVRYLTAGFQIEVRYRLDGAAAGSGASNIAEQITILNLGNSGLNFHFYQYSDFDLFGTPGGDELVFVNNNAVRQSEGALAISETVLTPVASRYEGDFSPVTLGHLNDGLPTNLTNAPLQTVPLGIGNVTWAYQWDVVIPSGNTFQISKVKKLVSVPEPATAWLLGVGCIGFWWVACRGRRRR